jgi:phosphoribosylanthranilate isomerase
VQFHGDETPEYCRRFKKQYKVIKAVRVDDNVNPDFLKKYAVDAFLLDAFQEGVYGGTGTTFPWHLAKAVKGINVPLILSGGLNPQNLLSAMETVRPYAVDVCSGVEKSPGQKNSHAMKEFIDILQIFQQ